MCNRLRLQGWERSILVNSAWCWDCWGTALESPILMWKWGLTDQHLGDQRKVAEGGRCCQPPQLSCSRAQTSLYLLPCFSPGCAYRCENRWASSSIRTCTWETTLLTNICEVGVLGCRKWTNDGFFFIVLHIINLFLGQEVNQHTKRWSG